MQLDQLTAPSLPPLAVQAQRLMSLGVHELGGWSAAEVNELAAAGGLDGRQAEGTCWSWTRPGCGRRHWHR